MNLQEYSILSKMKISRLLNYSMDMCHRCQGTTMHAWNYNAIIMHSILLDKHKVFTHLTEDFNHFGAFLQQKCEL